MLLRYFGASLLLFAVVGIFSLPILAAHVHVNIWWFESVSEGGVYGRIWSTQKYLFLLFGGLTYLFLTLIFIGTRALTYQPGQDQAARLVDLGVTLLSGCVAALTCILVGHAMADQWQTYLLASHRQSFGMADPIHHIDIGFYVFTMPWRETLGDFVASILIVGGIGLAGLATLYTVTSPYQTQRGDIRRVVAVGSLFAAVLLGYLAWRNFYLNPYDLTRPGTAFGGGATFAHASLWWYPIVGVSELIAVAVLLANTFLARSPLAAIIVLPMAFGIASSAGQAIFQRFVVAPNELSAEYRYLGYTLTYTRHAYGIDQWRSREYTPHTLTATDVSSDSATIHDAHIADAGAFTQVMRQRQEVRTYYTFNDADIDRYAVNGRVRQVLLAGRETEFVKLPDQAQTWVNEHLKFTHGYGLTMAPANTVTRDGQPVLWIQNVPVQESVHGLPAVRQPRIYFGEYTNSWIVTNATTPEFDSAQADRDTAYRYQGPDGIPVGSGLKRLTLSWVLEGGIPFFNRFNISGYIRSSSRLSLHRNIYDRIQTIAPWLVLDSNPYLVLRQNGSLVWMLDGMTRTDHYPYSDPTSGDNYRRNSVKITVDAYTGRPTFYAFQPQDPIVRAWSAAFPGLIHPFSQMPPDLVAHIKYPDDYLSWQADAYQRYHVTDITSYYNGDNQWDIESSTAYNWDDGASETNLLSPIWSVARLFGDRHDSFYSILPFSVRGKQIMAGYLAADNNTYRVTALDMPRGSQTMGVQQFESLYNQAPTISQTLTLLDQHGSQVVPGQVLILPIGKALLYIKPLYLRSQTSSTLPQLTKIVSGTQNAVNWGNTLNQSLDNLLTQGDISNAPTTGTGPGQQPVPSPTPSTVTPPAASQYARLSDAQLIALANSYYQAAQSTPSLTEKDRDLKQVGRILQVLQSRHRR
jgi:uncharacterized membrane protein (UPF0182 family)